MHTYGLSGHDITIWYLYTMGCSRFGFELLRDFHQLHTSHTYYKYTLYAVHTILYIEQYERKHEYGRSLFG